MNLTDKLDILDFSIIQKFLILSLKNLKFKKNLTTDIRY